MKNRQMTPNQYLMAAVVGFLIAGLAFSGLVLRDYLVARLAIGTIWVLVGIGWLAGYVRLRRQ